jgi:hypothetical protein
MTKWWLAAAVALAGCAKDEEEPPALDASGSVDATLTYGTGTCPKTGDEPFTFTVTKSADGTYTIADATPDVTVGGDVSCTMTTCQITYFKQWSDADFNAYDLRAMLMFDDATNAIIGTGTYRAVGAMLNCEHAVTIAGTLQ